MDDLELFQRLGVALAIGLLIGVERGWAAREEQEGERAAGVRTLALSGLLGGVMGAMALLVPEGAVVLAAGFVAFSATIAFFRYREMVHEKTFGATTVVAAMLAFALGGVAGLGELAAAGGACAAVTALLALKGALHGWLEKITWEELRAGLVLLAMTLVLLPLLPDRGFGPFQALNPSDLWVMTILIAAVSFAGYVAMKWVGGRHGIALSGVAGGLVSSTAVTLSFARLARQNPERIGVLVAGALLASVTMLLRILLVAGSINPALLRWLLLPLGLAALGTAAAALWQLWHQPDEGLLEPLHLKNPFELAAVLKFTLFLAAVMVAARGLVVGAGDRGAFALAAVSGIADVDALTLSMSRLSADGFAGETAAKAILIAAGVNTAAKAVMGWVAGGARPGVRLGAGAALGIAGGLAGAIFTHAFDPLAALGFGAGTP